MQKTSAKKSLLTLVAMALLTACVFGISMQAHGADPILDQVRAAIRLRLNGDTITESLACQGEMICGIRMLPQAYRRRNHLPLWIDASLNLEKAEAMATAISKAGEEGLSARDYHLDAINDLLADICEQSSTTGSASVPPELWVDLDLILTDAFLLYGSHLAAGRVNPETLHTDWKINPGAVDLLAALDDAASTGRVDATLDNLRPTHRGYTALRHALARLRNLASGRSWPSFDPGETLRPGDLHAAVDDLRQRLAASGDASPAAPDGDPLFFDTALESAVRRFQERNGLQVDGIVGRDTSGMLNIPVSRRIRQVEINLERWRWLPHDLGTRYIIVNTADFKLSAVENGRVALQMRVVVGRPARRSPVFSADMTYLVINPYWNVPTTIAVEDILPEIRKDVGYLAQRGIHVFQSWEVDAPEVDPAAVDWQDYHADRFPFRLRQDPGPYNALGRIKFMFPNLFAVYLHDTPNRALFNRVQRDFSSGCIRVESPAALADFVLAGDDRWTPDVLAESLEKGETRTIRLKQPVPVHLLYLTAWTDKTGDIQFRSDIYERDKALEAALDRRRPNNPPDFVRQPR
jgi:murein L,D-transpeptidase YcbB/YkuD